MIKIEENEHRRMASGQFDACGHTVEFYYEIGQDDIEELSVFENEAEERTRAMIAEDYIAGDLCCLIDDKEYFGYWKIVTS